MTEIEKRLAEIERRMNHATPGPWGAVPSARGVSIIWGPRLLAHQRGAKHYGSAAGVIANNVQPNNGDFIAHARDDMGWLLHLLREAL